ncbi:sugar dehydrogenase complex small subunit [Rhizobium sp.]|uniref:sugar dehydrogenase complex small subunit n=1 Tax=Rhizobium sp. TaxID=391 RepID=UPI0028968E31
MTENLDRKGLISRRRLIGLSVGGVLVASLGCLPTLAVAQEAMDQAGFQALSQRLTGRAVLDKVISDRAFAALTAEDVGFPAAAMRLTAALDQAGLVDMREFKQFAAANPALAPTAMKIISAWYLGYTGTPEGEANHDDARFVAFAGALMYEPTKDVTIVPTYARGHTNYWVDPPATLATD